MNLRSKLMDNLLLFPRSTDQYAADVWVADRHFADRSIAQLYAQKTYRPESEFIPLSSGSILIS